MRKQQGARAALAAMGLVCACSRPEFAPPPPRPVQVESPAPAPASTLVVFPGSVSARTESVLSFRVAGKLVERPARMGQQVAAGAMLARLETQDLRLEQDAALAAVGAADSELLLAQSEQRRYETLQQRGHAGQSAVDQRRNAARVAQARADQARTRRELARRAEDHAQLRSDAAGVITAVLAEPGNVLAAGEPVVRLAVDGEREVRIEVPEGQTAALVSASRIMVELFARPGHLFAGRLREIAPQADARRRMHEARITLVDPDESVHLGATATVIAVQDLPDGRPPAFVLPATALGNLEDGTPVVWAVRASADGRLLAQPQAVSILQYLPDGVIVGAEFQPTDRVVRSGVHRLRAGQAVQVIPAPAAGGSTGSAS